MACFNLLDGVATGSSKFLEVVQKKFLFFRTWKVLENQIGP